MKLDTTTETPDLVCVECGHAMDHTTGDGLPSPDDFTLCIKCGSLSVFDHTLRLRRPTDGEMLDAAGDRDVQRLRRAILKGAAR